MKGKVTAYSSAVNAGVIKGDDGKDYQFNHRQWRGRELPANKQSVNFENNSNQAQDVNCQKLKLKA